MKHSKLYYLLLQLSKTKRLNAFRRFLMISKSEKSPLVQLYDFWTKNKRFLKEEKIIPEDIINILVGKKKYKSANIHDFHRKLVEQIESFLLIRYLTKNKEQKEYLIMQIYHDLGIDKYYSATFEKIEKKNKQQEFYSIASKKKQFELNDYYYFESLHSKHNDKTASTRLEFANESLDSFYWLKKCQYICNMYTIKVQYKGDYPPYEALKKELELVPISLVDKSYPLQFYHTAATFFHRKDNNKILNDDAYYRFKNSFFSIVNDHIIDGAMDMFNLLMHISTLFFTSTSLTHEILDLYEKGLETKVIIEKDGTMPIDHFMNIVDIQIAFGNVEAVKKFIALEFIPLTQSEEEKANVRQLLEAFLLFSQKKYVETAAILSQLDLFQFNDFSYGLRKHTLSVRNHYEAWETNAYSDAVEKFDTACHTLKVYVNRKRAAQKIAIEQEQQHLNFIKMIKKISDANALKISKKVLKAELKSMTVVCSNWLTSKI
mgnify:CR=1 FL=1